VSAKIAICIGDYSNGWSDAIIVQDVLSFDQKKLQADRPFVLGLMADTVQSLVQQIEANELINPKPKDEACCKDFEAWAREQDSLSKIKVCPLCSTKMTPEREKKFSRTV